MKNIKNKLLTIAVYIYIISITSCSKYLEKAPDNRAELSSVEKIAQLMVSAYPKADYYCFAESASDNAEWKGDGVGSVDDAIIKPFLWEDYPEVAQGTTSYYWSSSYEAIAAANHALAAIEEKGDAKEYLPYKGEALICRAFAHFMLVTFYAKNYVPGGINDSPGIPYVTDPEIVVIKKYDRATVESVYESIEKDIVAGLPLLNNSAYKVKKYHFTKEAANAFAARFYLFKGNYDKVIEHATKVQPAEEWIPNLRPWTTTYLSATSSEMMNIFTDPNQKSTLLLIEAASWWGRWNTERAGFGEVLNKKLFGTNNVTGKKFYQRIWSYGVPHYTFIKFSEFFYFTGPGIGLGYVMMPVLTNDETILNRAEAFARKDKFKEALKDLNTFLTTRIEGFNANDEVTEAKIISFYTGQNLKEGIISSILDAKRAEFMQEGLRWFDLKRLDLEIVHYYSNPPNLPTTKVLPPGDPRRLFQIPDEVKLSGLAKNPR